MDKITYLKKKEAQQTQTFQKESFCYKCYKQSKNCLCHLVSSFSPVFQFVILMHPMEAKKEKMGTGRLSHLFLEGSKIITGVDFSQNEEVNQLIKEGNVYIMYPGENAINVSCGEVGKLKNQIEKNQRISIFLIDGTWPCAKKMMKLSKNLHDLPRISFDVTKESMFEIKEQPSKFCLSTIESIHLFLTECERRNLINIDHNQDKMLDAFKQMVEFQKQCAVDPALDSYRRKKQGYTPKSERTPSKKWESRSIIFKK